MSEKRKLVRDIIISKILADDMKAKKYRKKKMQGMTIEEWRERYYESRRKQNDLLRDRRDD